MHFEKNVIFFCVHVLKFDLSNPTRFQGLTFIRNGLSPQRDPWCVVILKCAKICHSLTKLFPLKLLLPELVKGPFADRICDRVSRRRNPSPACRNNDNDDDDDDDPKTGKCSSWVVAGYRLRRRYNHFGGSDSGNNISWTVSRINCHSFFSVEYNILIIGDFKQKELVLAVNTPLPNACLNRLLRRVLHRLFGLKFYSKL